MTLQIIPKWFPFLAISIWPFVLVKKGRRLSLVSVNHERIHHCQQIELLFVGFYLFYLIEFIIRLIQYKNWMDAYYNISFEREAYAKEYDHAYRAWRKPYTFIKYL